MSFGKLYQNESGRDNVRNQHRLILEAILSGDAEMAKDSAHQHIAYVKKMLEQFNVEDVRNQKIAAAAAETHRQITALNPGSNGTIGCRRSNQYRFATKTGR